MTKQSVLVLALALTTACGAAPRATDEPAAGGPGTWRTWVIASGDQMPLAPPPDADATRRELDELVRLAAGRDEAALARVAYWATGDPAYRWNEIALESAMDHEKWDDGSRVTSLLNVAIYDAMVAAWHWKQAYARPRPARFDASFASALEVPPTPSYPSEHAVAAGAASTVLAYLFPDVDFQTRADEACRSRLVAGAEFPSDVAAGLDLGRRVGAAVVERARTDNSDAVWQGEVPTAPGMWTGTDPSMPAMGTWKTWVIESGSALRPPPPPAFTEADAAEVRDFKRTTATTSAALRWASVPAMEIWHDVASRLVLEHDLDRDPPRAARVYALLHTAFLDATIAAWDAKYAYWGRRPDQLDPSIDPLVKMPNFPGYPSAHAVQSAAAAGVLGYLFPREAAELNAMAEEAAASRLWAGIHVRADNEAGLELGRAIARLAVERAKGDGADTRNRER